MHVTIPVEPAHLVNRPFHSVLSLPIQPPSAQSSPIRSSSAQSLSAQSLSAQSLSVQPLSVQSLIAQTPPEQPSSVQSSSVQSSSMWLWLLLALIGGVTIGISAYCFGRASVSHTSKPSPSNSSSLKPAAPKRKALAPKTGPNPNRSSPHSARPQQRPQVSHETIEITKIKTVETLIATLQTRDPQMRRQAIWELGQQGTSEAIAPLVSLMTTVDSQQRSLILGAISEIGIRTIQPLNRALVISLQDDNPDVRKNAIRDITRIYGLITQISQILCHAAADEDEEVRTTAHWALGQFNQMYHTSNLNSFEPSLQPSPQSPKSLP